MYYKNVLTRFVFRKNVHRRVMMRLRHYRRKLMKDSFDDMVLLFSGFPVNTVLDAGANIGFMTFQFMKHFPNAEIYAFEPNPSVYEKLEKSYKGNPRVFTYNVGIGKKQETMLFNLNANSGTSSFLKPTDYHTQHQAYRPMAPISVRVYTLDAFAERQGIDRVNILKLDIEGFELNALLGANSLLERKAIDVIFTEVNIVRSYQDQPLFHDICAFLEVRGYHLFGIDDFVGLESEIRQAVAGNAVFVSDVFRSMLEERHGKDNCGW